MKFWKVTINELQGSEIVETYNGIAEDATQAVDSAMKCARRDRQETIDTLVAEEKLTPEEVAEEQQAELYASEVTVISEVEFGI